MIESPHVPVPPVPPPLPAAPHPEPIEFPCANCGARMTWDPAADTLGCEFCQARVPVPRGEGTILERPLAEAGSAARGLDLEVRVAQCRNCGARVSYETHSTAEQCVYCGSANVLAQDANRNAIRPESLIPLTISRVEVEAAFLRWIRRGWFRPNALKKTARFEASGVYVPFWTFDCNVHSNWSADAGYHYWVTRSYTTTVNGRRVRRTRRVRKTRWVPAWGKRDDMFDDLLVLASKGLPAPMVERLGGFDTQGLVPYRAEYLAGWRAEEYQVDLEQGWHAGRAEVESIQHGRCARDVPGDTHRFLRVENHVSDVHWKHVLLPIWTLQYRYRGKGYSVLVHGLTGKLHGKAPLSVIKILLLIFGVIGLVLLVLILVGAGGALLGAN